MDYSKHKKLEFRRQFFKLFGAAIDIHDPDTGDAFGYIEMKAWQLREDVRIYSDNSKQNEMLRIHSRTIIDFGATYDVFDSSTDTLLFSLKRQGLKSTFVRDQWDISDPDGNNIANLQETSSGLALIRRYTDLIPVVGIIAEIAFMILPLTYQINGSVGGSATGIAARLVHRKNPFVVKIGLDMTNTEVPLDPRIGIAVASMLSVIDANKN